MDIVLPSIELLPEVITRLSALGYSHEGDLGITGREAFRQPLNGLPAHHLYACVAGAGALADHIDLRDYLRSHREAVIEYGELKKQLAALYPHDIDLYIAGKTPFITRCLRLARRQRPTPAHDSTAL